MKRSRAVGAPRAHRSWLSPASPGTSPWDGGLSLQAPGSPVPQVRRPGPQEAPGCVGARVLVEGLGMFAGPWGPGGVTHVLRRRPAGSVLRGGGMDAGLAVEELEGLPWQCLHFPRGMRAKAFPPGASRTETGKTHGVNRVPRCLWSWVPQTLLLPEPPAWALGWGWGFPGGV